MAKKTKSTPSTRGGSSLQDRRKRVDSAIESVELERRERAASRVELWAWLERALDHALDHAALGSDALSLWDGGVPALVRGLRPDPEAEAALDKAAVPLSREARDLLYDLADESFREELVPNILNRRLVHILRLGIARCQLLEAASPEPLVALSTWFSPKEAEDKWASYELALGETQLIARFSADLAAALKIARRLLEADLSLARKGRGFRPPADIEECVLRELLLADGACRADTLAKRIERRVQPDGKKRAIDAKGVSDAVDRLRKDCGYRIPNDGKTGYRVDDADRELAREHGVSDGTDGTLSE
ncbi:MAG: hypothetical protein GC172_05270 [Phycisphaera sp.]|nr:hypothetical protein [Phycisphaera sp.]